MRQARLDAGLSQRQLCGDVITRNMLSLIENGSARPSMDTLAYLAERLGKPMSFFLGEKSANAACLEKARAAYTQGRYAEAEALLKEYKPDGVQDEEFGLLKLLILLEMAVQYIVAIRKDFRYRPCVPLRDPELRSMFRTFLPTVFGAGVYQLT